MKTIFISCYVVILSLAGFNHSLHAGARTSWIEDWIDGFELAKCREFHRAIKAYNSAIQKTRAHSHGSYPFLHLERGQVLCSLGDYHRALRDLDLVIKSTKVSKEQRALAFKRRALAHSKLGNRDQAYRDLRRADEIEPHLTDGDCIEGYVVFCGKVGQEANKPLLAKMYRTFGVIDSEEDLFLSPSGMIVLKRGRQSYLQGSLESIKRAVESIIESFEGQ